MKMVKCSMVAIALCAAVMPNFADQTWTGTTINGVASRTGKVGIGVTAPAYMLEIASNYEWDARAVIASYNSNSARQPTLNFKKSHSSTLGVKAPTISGEILGSIEFDGVPSTSFSQGARITAVQDGTGSFVPAYIEFFTSSGSNVPLSRMIIDKNGNVLIGTTTRNTSYKLAVEGKIGAREVVVTTAAWADYVFKPDYNLKPLNQVENFIKKNGHLEGIPTAKEVGDKGVAVGEMQSKILEKVEELTLYVIELKKENEALKQSFKNELAAQKTLAK